MMTVVHYMQVELNPHTYNLTFQHMTNKKLMSHIYAHYVNCLCHLLVQQVL